MNELTFEVRRTKGDYVRALGANLLRSPAALAWYGFGAVVVAAIVAVMNEDVPLGERALRGLVALVLMLGFYAMIALVTVFLAARANWRVPGALAPITFRLSDQGLGGVTETSEGQSGWTNWKAAFETRSLIVIRHHANIIQILPKRDLAEDVVQRIRDILRANLKGRLQLMGATP